MNTKILLALIVAMNITKKTIKAEHDESMMNTKISRDSLATQNNRREWESIILHPEEWRQKRTLRFRELIRKGE